MYKKPILIRKNPADRWGQSCCAGVLVAVSIPIFTAQLKKAKLATNQANARAAYAEVTANMLDKGYTQATGTYDIDKAGMAGSVTNTATGTGISTAITQWKVSTKVGSVTMGDKTATKWTVSIDEDGVVKYSAAGGR